MAYPVIGYKTHWGLKIRGTSEWKKFLKEIEVKIGVNSQMASEIGSKSIQLIRNQLSKHVDIDGNRFERYGQKYAAYKGVGEDAVDMQLSRKMIDSVRYKSHFARHRAVIVVSPTGTKNKVKAWVHHIGAISGRRRGRFRQKRRKWFGLTDGNIKVICRIAVSNFESFLLHYPGRVPHQKKLFY